MTHGPPLRLLVTPPGGRSIGVHGDTVWVMYFIRSTALELISHDDGDRWVSGASMRASQISWKPRSGEHVGHLGVLRDRKCRRTVRLDQRRLAWHISQGNGGLFTNGAMVAALSAKHAFAGGGGGSRSL